ncbi:MAG: glycosyltransferase family 4 protein [Nitrospirota bacterium]
MKIVFVVEKKEDPGTRLRMLPVFESVRKEKADVKFIGAPKGLAGRVMMLAGLAGTDVLVLYRKLFKRFELIIIRFLCKRIVYDYDDALMFREVRLGKTLTAGPLRRFLRTVDASDEVVAGNSFLADFARQNCGKVNVLPTPIDTVRLVPREVTRDSNEVIIGWIGLKGNLVYLEELSGVFQRLALKHPNIALSIICNRFIDIDGVNVYKRMWSVDDEARFLQEMDIGIMPLTDDLWSRGKCGFKILQYFGAGKPAVASPVGINSEIIRHGVNGFLAGSEGEWEEFLSAMVSDRPLRERMGSEGRKAVEERYSLDKYLKRYSSIIGIGQ